MHNAVIATVLLVAQLTLTSCQLEAPASAHIDCTPVSMKERAPVTDEHVDGIEEEEGNGYEHIGIEGHGGVFKVFNWSPVELRSISMWHATLQYQNVIELVKEKLASTKLHPIARQTIETFIARHRPPRSVKSLLSKRDRKQIKLYHRSRDVDSILHVVRHRLAQLSPEAQQEVIAYLNPPCRDL